MKEQAIQWCLAAGMRAVKTFCQSVLSLVTVGQSLLNLNWVDVFWVSLTAAFISVLTSIVTGMPEVPDLSKDPSTSPEDGRLLMEKTEDGMKMNVEFNNDIYQLKNGDTFVLKVEDKEGNG